MTSFIQEVEFISATITFFLRVINLIYGLFDKGYFATIALGGGTFDCAGRRNIRLRWAAEHSIAPTPGTTANGWKRVAPSVYSIV